jgi:hypothetical protein
MQLGIIIFYLPEKGYGYLRLDGTREEFHFRAKNVVSPGIKKETWSDLTSARTGGATTRMRLPLRE